MQSFIENTLLSLSADILLQLEFIRENKVRMAWKLITMMGLSHENLNSKYKFERQYNEILFKINTLVVT